VFAFFLSAVLCSFYQTCARCIDTLTARSANVRSGQWTSGLLFPSALPLSTSIRARISRPLSLARSRSLCFHRVKYARLPSLPLCVLVGVASARVPRRPRDHCKSCT
jgi:hypothetical protein